MKFFLKNPDNITEVTPAIESEPIPEPITEPEEEWIWVEGYKGTDKDMCCRGYQYELGKQYDMPEDEEIKACKSGFHLCLRLSDVLGYYAVGAGHRFFKVKALVRKSDERNYCSYDTYGMRWASSVDKLAAKSIIFLSELTTDEILKGTDAENLPAEYKQIAIDIDIEHAVMYYQQHTLMKDGYSETFASYIVNANKFDIAHAFGSQKDLSMDMKVWSIFH
jgi:hypothetical protein